MTEATYQSEFPVKATITKMPSTDWEKKNGYAEVTIDGPRLSFASPWVLREMSNEIKSAWDATILIPMLEQNEAAQKEIIKAYNIAAAAVGSEWKKIKGKQQKVRRIKLGALRLDEDGDPMTDDDGNKLTQYNDGHMTIGTTNSTKGRNGPATFVNKAGQMVANKKLNSPEDLHVLYEMPTDTCGKTAQEVVGNGNNVRVRIAFSGTKDSYNGDKPKVYASMLLVQFLAEDEQFSESAGSGGDGGYRGDTSAFAPVATPAGEAFKGDADELESDLFGEDDDLGL